jgi:hypothetical protein
LTGEVAVGAILIAFREIPADTGSSHATDVVGVPECDEGTPALLLYPRVHNAKSIEVLGPFFERDRVVDTEHEVVESNGLLIEAFACTGSMRDHRYDQTA